MNKELNKRARRIFSLITFTVLLLGTLCPGINGQDENTVLANGNPPLTVGMAGRVVALLQWSLDVQFTTEQGSEILKGMMSYWEQNNRAEIESMIEIIKIADGVLKASEADRARVKEILRADLLRSLEADTGDRLSQMVLRVYKETHRAGLPTSRAPTPTAVGSGRIGGDGFSGIYVGTRNFASSMTSVQMDYVTFLPGGFVYWSLPVEGLLGFDPALAKRVSPDEWGKYDVAGNTIQVTLANGLRYAFIKENGRLKLQPHSGSSSVRTYTLLGSGDGLKLAGAYRRFEGDPAITFAKDGRFRDEGIFRNFGTMARPDGSTYQADARGGTGTYVIGQNTLELKYSDGRVKRVAFTVLPEVLEREPIRSFRLNYETFNLF